MTLRVIGAGWGRTGTESMREALNILGLGPCHHMFEVADNPIMKARWRSPDSWWTSFAATILQFVRTTTDRRSVAVGIVQKAFGDRAGDRDFMIGRCEAPVAEVVATVPATRLLVHRLGDGWEPLCAHLGVAVPAEPYPNRNTTAELQARVSLQADRP